VIHHGRLLYDGLLAALATRLAPFKLIRVTLNQNGEPLPILPEGAEILSWEQGTLTLRVARRDAPSLTAQLLQTLHVADLGVEDPPIEAVIDQLYSDPGAAAGAPLASGATPAVARVESGLVESEMLESGGAL
jgi:ABC-2 type transport system ATP-binding protein